MAINDTIDFELFRYSPSQAAAGLFAALFLATTAVHIHQLVKSRPRAWYFTPFVIGGLFQITGYTIRIPTHTNPESVPLFATQGILILLAPPLYAATIYMVLGRPITFLNSEHLSLIPVKWTTKVFVTGDILAFLMQVAGAGIMSAGSNSVDSYKTGENVTVAGLGVQLAFFGFFTVTCVVFHRRMRRNSTATAGAEEKPNGTLRGQSWESVLLALYTVSGLILVRSVFRLVEYIQGNDGYLISHEVFMYVFDAALMFLVMVVMNVWHPSGVLGGSWMGRKGDAESLELDSSLRELQAQSQS
ncbi:RTA1 domain-containing protein [Aspergillus mulundensis]|uniref:Putative RTA1 like protein n=1 Tax=Aspergillus mulundensis TaxID=1810919 RepID=A0A3D8R4J3_9EURO|nr:putative RTA1 like protein [Aspergillus mulundensis]RDW68939.1 putative RTA1 like protein [Aspergillus mulundensis]